ncbi:AAA family ATPase [Vibrio sp. 1F255]|uniref:AAA family ATPase n=1 Tax=Vibrio sp. 1F255 TaxID=3230009 RepID=UPI00352D9EEB
MGKKKASGRSNANKTNTSTSANTLGSGLSAIKNLTANEDSSELGTMASLLIGAQESFDAADHAKKEKISESLEDDIQLLVGELKKVIAANKRLESENKQTLSQTKNLEEAALLKKKQVEQKEKDLSKEEKQILVDKNKLSLEQADIATRLRDLEEKELDAESGFAQKNMDMLEEFRAKKEELHARLEKRKDDLEQQIDQLEETKTTISEEDNTALESKLRDIAEKENTLSDKEHELKQKTAVLDRKIKRLEMTESDAQAYRLEILDDVKNQYVHQIHNLESSKKVLANQIEQYQRSEKEQLAQLGAYSELQRKFGDSSAEQVLKELNDSRIKLSELKAQLDAKPSEQLEGAHKALTNEHQELQQSLVDTQTELAQVKTRLNKNMRSVVELEQMNFQKQVLEKHNELLKVRLDQLRDEVDELLSKQQSKSAFPALLNLDAKYRANALTETVPVLAEFARELQQRIAWDPTVNKELYYRLEDIQLFIAGLAMSRLHILQGISGTGKTSLAKAFARAIGGGCKTISVQAGWRDKGDLVGHYNAFEKKFYEQETLQGLYEAQCPSFSDRPYIILLDEMNLSRPEQYFAEFLSALELDPKDRILPLMTTELPGGPELLIDGRKLKIPENVWFIGTANHDETTFEFADKTYDRAHVMELPRHRNTFNIDKSLDKVTYSFKSLEKEFERASQKHSKTVKDMVKAMDASGFSMCLEEDFNVSWGNRLERHLHRFVPVLLETGSDLGFAVDHILATKVLRSGKATGRYDTDRTEISNLIDHLKEFWKEQKFNTGPTASLRLLEAELKIKSEI